MTNEVVCRKCGWQGSYCDCILSSITTTEEPPWEYIPVIYCPKCKTTVYEGNIERVPKEN